MSSASSLEKEKARSRSPANPREVDTTSDDESDDDLEPTLEKSLESAWNKVVALIEKQIPKNFLVFELGNPFTKHTKPEEITKEYFMSVRHLIIPKTVCDYSIDFANKINEFKTNWEYGDTSCNNEVWQRFMFPEIKKVQTLLKKEKWQEAFASLFGIYLFDHYDGGHWINDQEEYLDMTNFSGWFRKYSTSWKKLLERSDDELGLNCKGGLPEGYRENLLYVLEKQQENLNKDLLDTFDQFSSKKIRINIIPSEPPASTKVGKKSVKEGKEVKEGPSSKKAKKK